MRPKYQRARAYALGRLERELAPAFTYHSLVHTRDEVAPAADRLARLAGVDGERRLLLRTAAFYHDLGFVVQREEHEAAGIAILEAVLPEFGYSAAQVAAVAGMVRATRLPQSPGDELEALLADADLDVLGRRSYWTRQRDLRAEWAAFGQTMTDQEWCCLQLEFLRGHHYFTPQARMLRGGQKTANIRRLELLAAECVADA